MTGSRNRLSAARRWRSLLRRLTPRTIRETHAWFTALLALGEAVAAMQLVRSGALLCWLSQRYQHFALAMRDSLGSAAAASINEHELALAKQSNCVFVGGLGGCGMSRVIAARQHFAALASVCASLADRRRRRAPGRVDTAQFARLSARKVGCQQR
jgi:hypothetical protein